MGIRFNQLPAAVLSAAADIVPVMQAGVTRQVPLSQIANWTVQNATALSGSGGSALVGFLPSGTGAVAGTVQAELLRSVWIEQYGGGTGASAATNDTAYSRAHTYLKSLTGGTLLLGRGTYAFSTDWISTTDGFTIQGQGIGATVLQYSGTGNGIVLNGVNWNCIRDLTVDMNSSASSKNGLKNAGSWYTQFRNVRVIRALNAGCLVQDAKNDDTTQRGSYSTNLDHVFLGDSGLGNQDGLLLNSTGSGGVTFTNLREVH